MATLRFETSTHTDQDPPLSELGCGAIDGRATKRFIILAAWPRHEAGPMHVRSKLPERSVLTPRSQRFFFSFTAQVPMGPAINN